MKLPIGAKAGAERDLGALIRKLAGTGAAAPDDTAELAGMIERRDGTPAEGAFMFDEPVKTKWVVVPPPEVIESGRTAALREGYQLRPEYARQCFESVREELLDRIRDDDPHAEAIRAFLHDAAPTRPPMPAEDFFLFRLGEYCVSQCY